MAESKAAVFTIKSRNSAVRAALERATGRIRGKNSSRETRSIVAGNRNRTMLGRKIKKTDSGRIVRAIVSNEETDSFLRSETAQVAKKLGLVSSRSASATVALHVELALFENERMLSDAVDIMGAAIKTKFSSSDARKINSRLMGCADRIDGAMEMSGKLRFDGMEIFVKNAITRIKIISIVGAGRVAEGKTISIKIGSAIGKVDLI